MDQPSEDALVDALRQLYFLGAILEDGEISGLGACLRPKHLCAGIFYENMYSRALEHFESIRVERLKTDF